MGYIIKKYKRALILSLFGWLLCMSYLAYDYTIYQDLLLTHLMTPPYTYEMLFHVFMIFISPFLFLFIGYQDYSRTSYMLELENMSEKWKKTYDSLPDMIFVLDNEHRIVDANKATIDRLGRKILGTQFCYANLGRQCIPHDTCPHNRCINSNITIREELSNGSAFEITCSPITARNKAVIGSVHILKDITEKRRAEEEKRNLEAQLFQSQKMESLGRFAGGIVHDFNNLIAGILGNIELIKEKAGDDMPFKKNIDQIRLVTEKAARLTSSILTFSRKKAVNPKPVDINGTILNIGKLMERIIGKDIMLNIHPGEGDLTVNADEGQIDQILMNLAANARDAMPEGGCLSISTQKASSSKGQAARNEDKSLSLDPWHVTLDSDFVEISVTDTGTGMDEKTRERIFEPFFTTKESEKGTGLGLAIVYSIVKQHNGHIEVESKTGKGTTFRIFLPSATSL